ncbi:Predicted dehydrogenase [Chitinophaga costaii]|uniref:Predicted dehydrogenase n=1 Tax=Chitinophaga costaii TaxID=1335309 RepID=A0A1C4ARM4_9BACT|nr:oxidoreductase [Chitinophaga costaii]PUZ26716.1 oxidoreductase [Chitinophaga costaii]SCB97201.1 Predicted dehydrogenase [Chitinophaga costaii]
MTINVGLIGFGAGGRIFHAPFITNVAGLHLKRIREKRPENLAYIKAQYPDTEIVSEANEIINDPSIDLVVVATPNSSHLPLAKAALLAGKHVVVEKPFTITSADADELIAIAAQQKRILTVHHNRRWDSNAKTVEKIIKGGMLGTLVEFEAHYDRFRNYFRPGAWREEDMPGAGIWYDLGAHLVDQVQQLFGLPTAITADIRIQRPGGKTIDSFDVRLDYPGLKVTLKGGMLVREPGPTFLLYGTEGSFIKYGMDVQEDTLRAGGLPHGNTSWGLEPSNIWGKLNTTYNGQHFIGQVESERGDYTGFYQNVYDAITGKAPLIVTPQQARNTIRIIEIAMQSHSTRKTLPYSPGETIVV